jgi:hypothetical protein
MWGGLAAIAIGLATPQGAAAQAACRTDTLGAVQCNDPQSGTRPLPRPPVADRTPGLDQVLDKPPAGAAAPEVIPAWRKNSFGLTLMAPGEAPAGGRCRTDTLGNMRCP